ncbi:MAG: porin family protein [Bacteroidota bacterium]
MKNLFILSLAIFGFVLAANAQHAEIRLNGYTMGTFKDKVDSYYSSTDYFNGTINGGFQWGAGIEIKPNKLSGIEFLYNRLDTKAPMTYYNGGIKSGTYDAGINNFMLAVNRYFVSTSKVEGYGSVLAGVTSFKIGTATATKFGYGFRLGANVWATPKVGLKFQAQLMSASQAVGGGFYFGTGGAGAGVSSYSSFYQFGLGGGLVFKLGQ